MVIKKPARGERELESSKRKTTRNWLVIISTIIVAVAAVLASSCNSQRPVITSLEADPEWTVPLGSLQVTCNALSANGDDLIYEWSITGGTITGTGPEVIWTAPDSAGSYNVIVTVTDGAGGQETKQVTITVRANNPPSITSLAADADWTTPSGSLRVTCNATDPDGDDLSYEWSASGGSIAGTGPEVIWTAPEEVGMYNVTVVVTDGHGEEGTRSVYLSVSTGTPPTIEDLVVTAQHQYLKETPTGYKVGKTKEYNIECITSNTSGELTYEWSCDGGEISGDGSMITWTAPDTEGDFTVTVLVTDVAHNVVSKGVILNVVPCSACLFG